MKNTAKKKDDAVIWSGINEICRHFGDKSVITVLNYRRDLGCPLRKDGGVWIASEQEVLAWAKDLGIEDLSQIDHSAIFRLVARRKRTGPGVVISGDTNQISGKLQIATGTLLAALSHKDNPFSILPGPRGAAKIYSVDMNRWQDYVENQNVRGDQ